MRLLVNRTLRPDGTPGEMFVDGVHECFTLELPNKDGLPGSCIPAGTYKVELVPSDEFSRDAEFVALCQSLGVPVLIPRIMDIPTRSLIDIHWGNWVRNVKGCVEVGQTQNIAEEFVGNSRAAFAQLYPKIVKAVNGEGCWITLVGGATIGTEPVMGVDNSTQM